VEPVKIEVESREAVLMAVDLGGDLYEFRVPKLYGLMNAVKELTKAGEGGMEEAAVFGKIEDWLFGAMAEDDAERLRSRFADEDDSLDVPHMMQVFQELVKRAAERPSG
jgi:hypothetical protein